MTQTNADISRSFFVFVTGRDGAVRRVLIPADVQIGRNDTPASLQLFGRLSASLKEFTATDKSNALRLTDADTVSAIRINSSAPPTQVTVYLPSGPCNGQLHVIKDSSGTASSIPITISSSVGTIDGETSVTITADFGELAVAWSAVASEWIVIVDGSSTAGGGGGAPTDASYVVIGANGTLSNERVIRAGSDVSITDGGAGGNLTISSTNRADANATYVVMSATGSLTDERVLTPGVGITITDGGGGNGVTISAYATSSLPAKVIVPILAGAQMVDQVVFQTVAAFEFSPDGAQSMAPQGSSTYTAYFQPIVEVFPTGCTLETVLYNSTTNSFVNSSMLSCSEITSTMLSSGDLSGSLAGGTNMYKMLMRITNAGAGKAIGMGAKLAVTWT